MRESEGRIVRHEFLGQQVEQAYRAIGHYFVAFARLITTMRLILTEEVATPDDPGNQLARLALGSLDARNVTDAFFLACHTIGGLTDEDQKIAERLRNGHVYKALTRRNEIAHGDWLIYEWTEAKADVSVKDIPSLANLVRVQPRELSEPLRIEDLTAKDIENEAASVDALERMVCKFGLICTRQHDYAPGRPQAGVGVRDAFELIGPANHKKVQERPRNSPELWPNQQS